MAIRKSITDIINECAAHKTPKAKIEALRANSNAPLQTILSYTYDKGIEFLIPDTPPPWKPNEYEDEAKALLYTEARRLKIFIKGGGYDNLKQLKREQLFISLLEDVDNNDAHTLVHMISKKPFKGLSRKIVMEAFPNLIQNEE